MTRKCSKCGSKHEAPTGKNCTRGVELQTQLLSIADTLETVMARLDAVELDNEAKDKSPAPAPSNGKTVKPPATPSKGKTPKKKRQSSPPPHDSTTSEEDDERNTDDEAAARKARRRLADLGLLGDDTDEEAGPGARRRTKAPVSSGKCRTAEHRVRREIDWPHYYVYNNEGGAWYSKLTLPEFVYGFTCMIENAPPSEAPILLKYFKELMSDCAAGYKWEVVRGCHLIIGNMIEQERIRWADHDDIKDIRRQHVWNTAISRPNASGAHSQHTGRRHGAAANAHLPPPVPVTGPVTPCLAYQDRSCHQPGAHPPFYHICEFCYRQVDGRYPHPEVDCKRKFFAAGFPKNGPREQPLHHQ